MRHIVETEVQTVAQLIQALSELPQDLPIVKLTGVNGVQVVGKVHASVRKEKYPHELCFAVNETMQASPDRFYVFLS